MRSFRVSSVLASAGLSALLILGLAGCGSKTPAIGAKSIVGDDAVTASPRGQWKTAALAQLHGAPESIQAQMLQQISREAVRQGIVLRGDLGAKVDYTLRGYLLVEPGQGSAQGSTKVLYVWDVIDQNGNRVNRVSGEEVVKSAPGHGDRWASVSPAVLALIADKAVVSLGSAFGGGAAVGGASALGAAAPG